MKLLAELILLPPLLGFAVLVVAGRSLPRRTCEVLATLSVVASFMAALAAWIVFQNGPGGRLVIILARWFAAANINASMDVLIDPLSLTMAVMVTFVASIIHIHSIGYMRGEEGYLRYFAALNLFVFSMLVITLADNLLFLFLGWEGVGFCSYSLIGHWRGETFRGMAGQKAFLLTRIGDIGFVAALAILAATTATFSISGLNAMPYNLPQSTLAILGFLFLFAATGKSAQLPLLVWLPDAMAGPTPVSALIHAATMVTAGVYLLMRLFPLISASPMVMLTVAVVGALTAFWGCLAALGQRDLKRILAWSTISQVGYMLLALGCGDLAGSMFHLLAHAFFKSLLFLAAGCLIQTLHEEQDILKMGGFARKAAPAVFCLFLIGSLALAAIPPTSGFFSKGRILEDVIRHAGPSSPIYEVLFILAALGAVLTALYTFRMIFLAFSGKPVQSPRHEPAALPPIMTRILWPLALLALCAGLLNLPFGPRGHGWLDGLLAGIPGVEPLPGRESGFFAELIDLGAGVAGFVLAWLLYAPRRRPAGSALARREDTVFGITRGGLGLDALYRAVFARPYGVLARILWKGVDNGVIDGAVMGSGRMMTAGSAALRPLSTGKLSLYLAVLAGTLALILVTLATGLALGVHV